MLSYSANALFLLLRTTPEAQAGSSPCSAFQQAACIDRPHKGFQVSVVGG